MRRPDGSDNHRTSATIAEAFTAMVDQERFQRCGDQHRYALSLRYGVPPSAKVSHYEVAEAFGEDGANVSLAKDMKLSERPRRADALARGWCEGLIDYPYGFTVWVHKTRTNHDDTETLDP